MRLAVALRSLAIGLTLLATAPAQAVPLTLQVYADGVFIGQSDQTALGCVDNPDGVSAMCDASGITYTGDYDAVSIDEFHFLIDSDPVVNGAMTTTNLQAFNQVFTFVFNLPVSALPATLTGGSARGTVTDTGSDGATMTVGPDGAIYTALIDGNPYSGAATQLLTGTYLDASGGGPTSTPSESFGVPIPSLVGIPVTTSIGIQLQFGLTGFDQGSITSRHEVVAPEPHTAALLGMGLTWLTIKRRRSVRL